MDDPSWPNLDPAAPDLESLPEEPTPGQIVRVLGTALLAFGQLWPRAVQALLYLKLAVERLERLPREEDIAATAQRVAEAAKRKAQQIANLTPDVVGDLIKTEVKEALAQQRASDLRVVADKIEADRIAKLADDKIRAGERGRMRRDIIVAVVSGIILLVAGCLVTFAEGRMRGFAERAAMAPTAPPVFVFPAPSR